jgi:hypothetical protein
MRSLLTLSRCCSHIASVLFATTLVVASTGHAQVSEKAKVTPLFEVFATYSRPPVSSSLRDVLAPAGTLEPGGGLGVAVGILLFSRFEIAGFYEGATASLRRVGGAGNVDVGRNNIGLRVEVPVLKLPNDFHLLLSGSAFRQELEDFSAPLPTPNPGGAATLFVQQRALGGRLEAGIEHRGFIGTTWFVTGGITMAGAGRGLSGAVSDRGIGVQPIATVGLRTRGW